MTENPYKSPRAYGYTESRKRRSLRGLSGPLLVFGVVFFVVAMSMSAMTVAPEMVRTLAYITAATGIASLLCFGLAFLAFSRSKRANGRDKEEDV